jgi:hypothetical protein
MGAAGASKKDINLNATMRKLNNFAEGFVTFQLTPYESAKLPYSVGIHMNLGVEYTDKTAYIFERDLDTNTYERKSIVAVNEIGNVMLNTDEMSDIMVLIAE